MSKDYHLPNGGLYRSTTGAAGAVEHLLRSRGMEQRMRAVAEAAAGRARTQSTEPNAIKASTELLRDRWRAVVTNTSPTAMTQEYGVKSVSGRKRPVLARKPLGHALDWVASQDPNRRRGGRASRG